MKETIKDWILVILGLTVLVVCIVAPVVYGVIKFIAYTKLAFGN